MKIHTQSGFYSGLGCADYFFNYFSLGIDILFDVHTHIVKKIILHTNFPSHYEFNQYAKCNFIIVPDRGDIFAESPSGVTCDTKWDEVLKIFGQLGNPTKPVVHSRGSNSNPFGATLFYGYKGIIFEVMQNTHIASVCLFNGS